MSTFKFQREQDSDWIEVKEKYLSGHGLVNGILDGIVKENR